MDTLTTPSPAVGVADMLNIFRGLPAPVQRQFDRHVRDESVDAHRNARRMRITAVLHFVLFVLLAVAVAAYGQLIPTPLAIILGVATAVAVAAGSASYARREDTAELYAGLAAAVFVTNNRPAQQESPDPADDERTDDEQ
ncbi:hypothetical protein [Crossiella sp. NPDC003009]